LTKVGSPVGVFHRLTRYEKVKGTMKRHRNHVVIFLLLTGLYGCSDEKIVQPEQSFEPVISNLIAPELLYNASQTKHLVAVDVSEPQGREDIAEVRYSISSVSSGAAVSDGTLRDDGSAGDNIPNDAQFSALIGGDFANGQTGEFELRVSAVDRSGNNSNILTAAIFVLEGTENTAPVVVQVSAPTAIAADSSFDFIITATVEDADGSGDVARVLYQFFPPAHPNPTRQDSLTDTGENGDAVAGDGVYSVSLPSGLIREASDYFFRLEAEDKAGAKSKAKIVTIRGVFQNPQAPTLSNLVAPDTVQIDPSNVVQIVMTIDVFDPQGLSDIKFVRFRSFLPNGNEATDSPFDLSDDGNTAVTGDESAGDGTFSILINLPPGTTPGNFLFIFQAEDKSGEQSNVIEHTLTVIQ